MREVRLDDDLPPDAPVDLAAEPLLNGVTLSWTQPFDNGNPITVLQYRRSEDGGQTWDPDWTDIPGSGASTTSYTMTGLEFSKIYRFEVRAVNAIDAGPAVWVEEVSPLAPPRRLTLSSDTVTEGDAAGVTATCAFDGGGHRFLGGDAGSHVG